MKNWEIPPNIIRNPTSEDLKGIVNNVNLFWVATNFIFLFSILESSARQIVRVTHPGKFNHGRGNLKQIYNALLSTKFAQYDLMLDLFQLARNTLHNNGVYFPEKFENTQKNYFLIQIKKRAYAAKVINYSFSRMKKLNTLSHKG